MAIDIDTEIDIGVFRVEYKRIREPDRVHRRTSDTGRPRVYSEGTLRHFGEDSIKSTNLVSYVAIECLVHAYAGERRKSSYKKATFLWIPTKCRYGRCPYTDSNFVVR